MPRSNPHARERVMDDRKHLDAFARSCPSRGAKRRSCLRLVGRVGALSKLPRTQSVTKRCSRRVEWGLSSLPKKQEDSSTRGSRPVPTMKAVRKDGGNRHPHGSLSRPPVAIRTSGTGATANLSVVLLGDESHRGPVATRRRRTDRAPCTASRRSEEPTFRMGRAHDRIVVAEVGRTASSSWKCAAPGNRGGVRKRNAAGGNSRGASDRPADGRRSGSSVLAATVTGWS